MFKLRRVMRLHFERTNSKIRLNMLKSRVLSFFEREEQFRRFNP